MKHTKKEQRQLDAIGLVDIDKVSQIITERNDKSDEMLTDLTDNIDDIGMGVWDYNFVIDLANYRENEKDISEKQYEQLLRIYNKFL